MDLYTAANNDESSRPGYRQWRHHFFQQLGSYAFCGEANSVALPTELAYFRGDVGRGLHSIVLADSISIREFVFQLFQRFALCFRKFEVDE